MFCTLEEAIARSSLPISVTFDTDKRPDGLWVVADARQDHEVGCRQIGNAKAYYKWRRRAAAGGVA
jgi:hypothetical protein